ncbi:GNAT family N-acetyltransferase [Paenibacillus radicibacter]|uniref:GNAT family N-acetyltransferase n=1 Tax=Paenibacillus radicibacter TaxID=2972488 RepID=UPI00215927B2|nr:GNAT family protein [Paenibacillus radicibacter]
MKTILEGQGIVLRYAMESDIDEYLVMLNDPESTRLTGSQQEFSRERIEAWLRKISIPSDERADFMIVSTETGELIGEVVLNEMDTINRSANIRIGIQGTAHRGKGYGTEAMRLMIGYGFEKLGLHRIHLGVFVFNPRAIHVYEKLGFKREGVERDVLYLDGEYQDMIKMSILEDEYRVLYRAE